MEPSFSDAELVVAYRGLAAGRLHLNRGDVVILRLGPEEPSRMKRIAGLAGDTLLMKGGRLYQNGRAFQDTSASVDAALLHAAPPGEWHYGFIPTPFRSRGYRPTGAEWGPVVVPAGQIFVLGDNLSNSGDSRRFGFVRETEVSGKVLIPF